MHLKQSARLIRKIWHVSVISIATAKPWFKHGSNTRESAAAFPTTHRSGLCRLKGRIDRTGAYSQTAGFWKRHWRKNVLPRRLMQHSYKADEERQFEQQTESLIALASPSSIRKLHNTLNVIRCPEQPSVDYAQGQRVVIEDQQILSELESVRVRLELEAESLIEQAVTVFRAKLHALAQGNWLHIEKQSVLRRNDKKPSFKPGFLCFHFILRKPFSAKNAILIFDSFFFPAAFITQQ